jgi:hypothetical protein
MNKPNTKELRDNANALRRRSRSNDDFFYTASLLEKAANFINSLEGKHICEWPKELTRDYLTWCSELHPSLNKMAEVFKSLAAIAPEAPKKRKVEIWEDCDGELYFSEKDAKEHSPQRYVPFPLIKKVGECEIDKQ